MMSALALRRFAFAFGAAFALAYVVALFQDLALFTVYPSLGIVIWGAHHSRDVADPAMGFLAPEMLWYGWTATAVIAGLIVGLVTAVTPDWWTRRLWPRLLCATPIVAMAACVYHTLPSVPNACRKQDRTAPRQLALSSLVQPYAPPEGLD
jgi:hypothetical protein